MPASGDVSALRIGSTGSDLVVDGRIACDPVESCADGNDVARRIPFGSGAVAVEKRRDGYGPRRTDFEQVRPDASGFERLKVCLGVEFDAFIRIGEAVASVVGQFQPDAKCVGGRRTGEVGRERCFGCRYVGHESRADSVVFESQPGIQDQVACGVGERADQAEFRIGPFLRIAAFVGFQCLVTSPKIPNRKRALVAETCEDAVSLFVKDARRNAAIVQKPGPGKLVGLLALGGVFAAEAEVFDAALVAKILIKEPDAASCTDVGFERDDGDDECCDEQALNEVAFRHAGRRYESPAFGVRQVVGRNDAFDPAIACGRWCVVRDCRQRKKKEEQADDDARRSRLQHCVHRMRQVHRQVY